MGIYLLLISIIGHIRKTVEAQFKLPKTLAIRKNIIKLINLCKLYRKWSVRQLNSTRRKQNTPPFTLYMKIFLEFINGISVIILRVYQKQPLLPTKDGLRSVYILHSPKLTCKITLDMLMVVFIGILASYTPG